MFVRSITLAIVILHLNSIALAQERRELGVQFGGSYYYGDFNESMHFYQPSPAFGAMFRYNLDKYYALRLSGIYSNLKATNPSYYLPHNPSASSSSFFEIEGVAEFNFLMFNSRDVYKENIAPFVTLGLGAIFIDGMVSAHIPIGLGLKYTPRNRFTVGLEWRVHKTFSDNFDGYPSISDGTPVFLHNKDWFSFVGLFVTYRLHNNADVCPAYK
jgi:hypothetical protein